MRYLRPSTSDTYPRLIDHELTWNEDAPYFLTDLSYDLFTQLRKVSVDKQG